MPLRCSGILGLEAALEIPASCFYREQNLYFTSRITVWGNAMLDKNYVRENLEAVR